MYGLFSFIFGTIIGSFLNVCIYRIPKRESIIFPPSHCPHCNEKILPIHNIPILSYLFLRGRCKACRQRISIFYPIVELISGLLSLFLFIKFGLSLKYFIYFAFFASLLLISCIDLAHRIIPDILSLPGIAIGIALSIPGWSVPFTVSITGVCLGALIPAFVAYGYYFFTKREGLGGGDIKLLAMIGAFVGWEGVLFTLVAGSLLGCIIGVFVISLKSAGRFYEIPFGPFLALGTLVYMFYGNILLNWYFDTLHALV